MMTVVLSAPLSFRRARSSSARLLPVGRLSMKCRAEFQRKLPEVFGVEEWGLVVTVSAGGAAVKAATVSLATAASPVRVSPAPPATEREAQPAVKRGAVSKVKVTPVEGTPRGGICA